MARTSRSIQARFTLIEVIVSIILLVTVIGLLFLSTGTVMSSWAHLERHAGSFKEVLALDRTLDTLLSNIIPVTWPDEDLEGPKLVFQGENDKLIFTYIHSFNQLEDGAIRSCCLVKEENNLVAYYCERPPFPESLKSDRLNRSVLAHNVDSVEFSFIDLDEVDIEFIDDWEDRDYLPLGVLMHVEWIDGTYNNWFRRTAGSSYFERWGNWEQRERL